MKLASIDVCYYCFPAKLYSVVSLLYVHVAVAAVVFGYTHCSFIGIPEMRAPGLIVTLVPRAVITGGVEPPFSIIITGR